MTIVELLKDLTQATYDSVEAYRRSADKAESPALTQSLRRRVGERTELLNRLNTALENHGEDSVDDASISVYGRDIVKSITNAFSDGDAAAAKQVEQAEDRLVEKFAEALKRDDLNSDTRMLIESAFREVREGERFTNMIEKQYA